MKQTRADIQMLLYYRTNSFEDKCHFLLFFSLSRRTNATSENADPVVASESQGELKYV